MMRLGRQAEQTRFAPAKVPPACMLCPNSHFPVTNTGILQIEFAYA